MLKKQHRRISRDSQRGRGAAGTRPDAPDAPPRNQGTWGEGRERVAQGAGEGLGGGHAESEVSQERDRSARETTVAIDDGAQGGQGRSSRAQANPRGANLDEDYEENTEIKRETEFRDATAQPLAPGAGGPKVTRDNDLFGKEGE